MTMLSGLSVRTAGIVVVTLLAGLLLSGVGSAGPVLAHPFGAGPPPTALLTAQDRTVTIRWTADSDDVADLLEGVGAVPDGTAEAYLLAEEGLGLEGLDRGSAGIGPGLGEGVAEPGERRAGLDEDLEPLSSDERRAASADPRFAERIESGMAVEQDGTPCPGALALPDDAFLEPIEATFTCPERVDVVDVQIDLLLDRDPGYRTVGLVDDDPPEVVAVFTEVAPRHRLDLSPGATRSGLVGLGAWQPPGGTWLEDRLVGIADVDVGPLGALAAIATAVAVGAGHALAPGHAKIAAGAFIGGTRARIRHAVALGVTVASMHAMTTLLLAVVLVALPWSPDLGPAAGGVLTLIAGTLLVGVGATMLLRHRRSGSAAHAHAHTSAHTHAHAGGHDHADVTPGSWRGLLAIGFAGGLLPSPSALFVLATTWLAGRPVLGLSLVAAFAVGLGATITLVGVLASGGRSLLEASERPALVRIVGAVPVAAAVLVVVGGAWITVAGALQFTG